MKDIDKPYRITIEHYDTKITIERDRSDITFDEYLDMLRDISLCAGWSANSVHEIFSE